MAKDPKKGLATTVKYTISPQASPTGTKVLQILVSAPRTRKGAKPPVKPANIPPPPSAEKGETIKPRAGASLAQVCIDGKPTRYTAGRSAEIARMHDGNSVACYEIGAIIRQDRARVAEARARGLDPRGFVPSWDAPRSSEASEDSPKLSFATAENTAIMDAHNARVQPMVDRIDAHNALVAVKYGAGVAYPCHNNARKVRRKCRTYGACAARRTLHHVCQRVCDNIAAPVGMVGATCPNLRQHCRTGQIAPLWRLAGHACGNVARKARAKFQKETARNFRGT